MSDFDPNPQCPKCGSILIRLRHEHGWFGDYLEAHCFNCKYTYKMKTRDNKDKGEKANDKHG